MMYHNVRHVGGLRTERLGDVRERSRDRLLLDLRATPGLGEYLTSMPDVGDDADFERPRDMPRTVDL